MRGPGWRWGVVAALTAALVTAPTVVAELPVDETDVDAVTLLGRVRASDTVAWSGYGEARGDLVLPDVDQLGDLPELISGTTRLRAWWRGPAEFRVDALSLVGESDVAVDGPRTWLWESADRAATLVVGEIEARLPRGADLLAPALGARLARSEATVAERLPPRRVAGVDAPGLRLRPSEPGTTTVERVDLWVEPDSGLVLRVELHARGVEGAALTSLLLDLDLSAPAREHLTFSPPRGSRVDIVEVPDLAAAVDRFAPFQLPDSLAGLPRRQQLADLADGVGTYGDGFTALTLLPLDQGNASGLLGSLRRPGDDLDRATFSTALLQGLVAREGDRAYLLVGTVPPEVLQRALAQLRASPPPRRLR